MMTCAEAVQQLWDYLDGSLPEEGRAAIDGHLSFCRRCCGEVEFAEELRGFLSQHAAEEVPSDVRQRLSDLLDQLEAQT